MHPWLPGRYKQRRPDPRLLGVISHCTACGDVRTLEDARAARAWGRPGLCRSCAETSIKLLRPEPEQPS
jgi:hypothetical protein